MKIRSVPLRFDRVVINKVMIPAFLFHPLHLFCAGKLNLTYYQYSQSSLRPCCSRSSFPFLPYIGGFFCVVVLALSAAVVLLAPAADGPVTSPRAGNLDISNAAMRIMAQAAFASPIDCRTCAAKEIKSVINK